MLQGQARVLIDLRQAHPQSLPLSGASTLATVAGCTPPTLMGHLPAFWHLLARGYRSPLLIVAGRVCICSLPPCPQYGSPSRRSSSEADMSEKQGRVATSSAQHFTVRSMRASSASAMICVSSLPSLTYHPRVAQVLRASANTPRFGQFPNG